MNINDLTLGQLKEISALFNGQPISTSCPPLNSHHPFEIGKNYIIRTVTMIYTGKLVAVYPNELVLVDCSWIPETERYMDFVATGKVKECEPYPEGKLVPIGRGGLMDAVVLDAQLPRSQK